MDSTFNIYQDILPAFNMYSGLKPCHEKITNHLILTRKLKPYKNKLIMI